MIYLGVVFLAFILLGCLWVSWIYGLASDINLRQLTNLYCLIYGFSSFLCFFSFWYYPLHVCYTFCSCPIALGYSVPFFSVFFSFDFFSFRSFYRHILKLKDSFLSLIQSTSNPLKEFSIFVTVFLISNISFGFLELPPFCLYYPSVPVCCLLFPVESLAYTS